MVFIVIKCEVSAGQRSEEETDYDRDSDTGWPEL